LPDLPRESVPSSVNVPKGFCLGIAGKLWALRYQFTKSGFLLFHKGHKKLGLRDLGEHSFIDMDIKDQRQGTLCWVTWQPSQDWILGILTLVPSSVRWLHPSFPHLLYGEGKTLGTLNTPRGL
jgi:hypothetical protein